MAENVQNYVGGLSHDGFEFRLQTVVDGVRVGGTVLKFGKREEAEAARDELLKHHPEWKGLKSIRSLTVA